MPLLQIQGIIKNLKTIKELKPGINLFNVQLAYANPEIKRYQHEIEEIEGKALDLQAPAKMIKVSGAARENVLLRMIEVKQRKCAWSGCVCVRIDELENSIEPGVGTKNRKEKDRKLMEDIFKGAEPLKEDDLFLLAIMRKKKQKKEKEISMASCTDGSRF